MPYEDTPDPDQATLELAGMVIDELKNVDFAPGSFSHYSYYLDNVDAQLALAQVFARLNITQVVELPHDRSVK